MKKEEVAAVWESIDNLVPWDQNPRLNDQSVDKVATSIKRFGFGAPIVARREDKMVIAGHTRLKAAKQLGLDTVPVRYLDLDPADAKMLALADNKIGEIADWDNDELDRIIDDLALSAEDMEDLGWNSSDLDSLFEPIFDGQEDEVIEVCDDEPVSKLGEVYELGEHRLICGDSTIPETWNNLMQGEEAQLCITDPPYGISYIGKTKESLTIQNDEQSVEDLEGFLDRVFLCIKNQMKEGASIYVFAPPGDRMTAFCNSLYRLELFRHSLVWNKDRFVLGRADYHYKHEIVFYGWKGGASHYFVEDRTKNTVLDFQRPSANREHPTMKPIELLCELVINSSKRDWVVIDAFGGSGSTLIAAAQTKRRARLVELDPKYCDVIRKRWYKYAKENNLDVGDGLDG